MRVCCFFSTLDQESLENGTWLEKAHPFLKTVERKDIYFVTHRLTGAVRETENVYYCWGLKRFRMTLCRSVLRAIEEFRWIPPILAWFPLQLCQREFVELVLACDPDVVVLSDLRWGRQFAKILNKYLPGGTCIITPSQVVNVSIEARRCDPSRKVSIVMPTYNGSKYIRRSIESCLKQTYSNIELLVVDDGSTDNTAKIVSEFRDDRIRYFKHLTNRGIAEGLNTGFRNSTGAYVTWTSDDNYYADTAIEEMVRFLRTYEHVDFVYAENYIIDENSCWGVGASGYSPPSKESGALIRRNEPSESLGENNFIGACFLYTRKVYETVGDYNPQTFLAEDYDYWVRVSKQFNMQRLFKPLYYYRFHDNSLTSKCGLVEVAKKVRLVKELNQVHRNQA